MFDRKVLTEGVIRGPILPILALMLAGIVFAFWPNPAQAATTFTVNRTGDAPDRKITDMVCDTSSKRGKQCTLRAAIQESNDTPGPDTINFNIGGAASVKSFFPASPLPAITEGLTMNGYSQPGARANTRIEGDDAILKIGLIGVNAGPNANGLTITAADSTIKGLVVNQFQANGVHIEGQGATNNTVQGSFIGTDASGTQALGNDLNGVYISDGSSHNTIGGTTTKARNVISSNRPASSDGVARGDGINIHGGSSTGNKVMGSYIGTDKSGTRGLGNSRYGVLIDGAPNNTIGGTVNGARNIVSGNTFYGVSIVGSAATNNTVEGNYIGTDASGTQALANGFYGVYIEGAPNNIIGGTADGARNTISGNGFDGIYIFSTGATGNKVQGNYIGTDKSGSRYLGNGIQGQSPGQGGVTIFAASDNAIGGTIPAARNVISGNRSGVILQTATNNIVEGNYIGTDVSGAQDLANFSYGVYVENASDNSIGGTTTGARNIISNNGLSGVSIKFSSNGNKVQGNYIGTDASGTQDMGNGRNGFLNEETGSGVSISVIPDDNLIGGTETGARNVISDNERSGVFIGNGASGNRLEGNYIGTKADGSGDLGNGTSGVHVDDADSNTIGGSAAGAGNLIYNNGAFGILMDASFGGRGPSSNAVQGNDITANTSGGVRLQSAFDNTIGGATTAAANSIHSNGAVGVRVLSGTGNSILSNSIFSNENFSTPQSELGIDLGTTSGVTPNDEDDPDTGANNLQNFPVITSATRDSASSETLITGTLNSTPDQEYHIQCFKADADGINHGEGDILLGEATATTNADGDTAFTCTSAPNALAVGDEVSATATNTSTGDTSEFSQNAAVRSDP